MKIFDDRCNPSDSELIVARARERVARRRERERKGGRERHGEYDKAVLDARDKPEGSRMEAQRRKPPSAKAPKSEGC